MNKKKIKLICTLVSFMMISSGASSIAIGKELQNNQVALSQNTCEDDTNSSECYGFKHFDNENDAKNEKVDKEPIGKDKEVIKKSSRSLSLYSERRQEKYTIKYLNSLEYDKLVEVISSVTWEQIEGLFEYSDDSYEFYSDANRVQAVINALEKKGREYTNTDHKGIPTLVEVLRSGFYIAFYNEPLNYMYEREYREKCIPAILSVQSNPNFRLGTNTQNEVVLSMGKLIGNAACDDRVVNNFNNILSEYTSNFEQYKKDISKGNAVFEVIKGISYDLESYAQHNYDKISNSHWYHKIDGFIDKVGSFAAMQPVTEDNEWLINNGLYYVGKLAKYHSNPVEKQRVVENALKIYPYLSEQYFTALDTIKYNFDGKLIDGSEIDIEKIKEDGKKHYLPNVYEFENGKMIIKAGKDVTKEKIERLYWASKEVRAQFHRVVGNDKPLEEGNADDVLTMVIYNNPKEYKLNTKLYGYSTDNGGIYIENKGTFFTYERTVNDSIFSLEELFRHEYTHYLQGRYLVPGMWGTSDFYKNNSNRLTWFDEGTAEFFAGSTRENNIMPRQSQVMGISRNPQERYTTEKLFTSSYGVWDFYNYGYAFSDYIYNNRMDIFDTLNDKIKANDVKGYDNYIQSLIRDNNINNGYQNHMQSLVAKYDDLTTPLVSDDYLKDHEYVESDIIYSNIKKVSNLGNVKTSEEKGEFFDTFTLRGTYTGDKAYGELLDWQKMNSKANSFIKELNNLKWSGYKTVNCYFVNYRVNNYGLYEYDVVFTGILKDDIKSKNIKPIAKIASLSESIVGNEISFSSDESFDEDGKIIEYIWDFGDGSRSSEKNPTHMYKKDGIYTVVLKVKDDKGAIGETVKTIKITKQSTGDKIDLEPNNNFKEAIELKKLNNRFDGELIGNDMQDIYYFDVKSNGEININVENIKNGDLTWQLFSEENLNESVAYPTDNTLKGKYVINKPGRYYLYIYKYSDKDCNYIFNIDKDEKEFMEIESNNRFEKANQIEFNQIVKGNLNGSDNKDIFTFDLREDKDIHIELKKFNDIGLNWILYNEKDLKNYVSYANLENGVYKNTFKAAKGKYYLCVYKYDNKDGNYELIVK